MEGGGGCLVVMAKKKQQTGKRTLRRWPDDVGWPRVWVPTRDVVGHHPGSRRLLYSVTMITYTHRNQKRKKKKTKECCCLLGEAVRRMLRLCEIGQGDDRRGENERKKLSEASDRPESQWLLWLSNDG